MRKRVACARTCFGQLANAPNSGAVITRCLPSGRPCAPRPRKGNTAARCRRTCTCHMHTCTHARPKQLNREHCCAPLLRWPASAGAGAVALPPCRWRAQPAPERAHPLPPHHLPQVQVGAFLRPRPPLTLPPPRRPLPRGVAIVLLGLPSTAHGARGGRTSRPAARERHASTRVAAHLQPLCRCYRRRLLGRMHMQQCRAGHHHDACCT